MRKWELEHLIEVLTLRVNVLENRVDIPNKSSYSRYMLPDQKLNPDLVELFNEWYTEVKALAKQETDKTVREALGLVFDAP